MDNRVSIAGHISLESMDVLRAIADYVQAQIGIRPEPTHIRVDYDDDGVNGLLGATVQLDLDAIRTLATKD